MREITEHEAYRLLAENYERLAVDYVILEQEEEYRGLPTHRKAVLEALRILRERNGEDEETVCEERMQAVPERMEELLKLPDDAYDGAKKEKCRSFSVPDPIPYWFAFLEPPHGVPYSVRDFVSLSSVLFPRAEDCEAYRWSGDFSSYFDEGKEWWGTGLWTVYDRAAGTVTVIGASASD